jgi:ribosomal protein S18 acetylase RimI-like enzyme
MAEITTRRIDADEFALLRTIRLAALEDAPEMFAQTLDEARKLTDDDWRSRSLRFAAGADGVCFLAERGGEPVGMIYGFLDDEHDHVARVGGMWVAPHGRRAGIGTALLSRVCGWATQGGRAELRFHVFHAGEGAQRFYRSRGFEPLSTQPDDAGFVEFGARLDA